MTTSLDTTVLEAVLTGRIVGPQDADWDTARAAWNLSVDQRPAFVAQVATADDVAEVIRFARSAGLRVAPQGTGHNAAAHRRSRPARCCCAPTHCVRSPSTPSAASSGSAPACSGARSPRRSHRTA